MTQVVLVSFRVTRLLGNPNTATNRDKLLIGKNLFILINEGNNIPN